MSIANRTALCLQLLYSGLLHLNHHLLLAPEKNQHRYQMTSVVGGVASSSPPGIHNYPNIGYFEAKSLTRPKKSPSRPPRNKTKIKLTPKPHKREISNAKCESSDRSFSRPYDLQRHWLSRHSGEPPRWLYAYYEGEKSYCREDKLKEHLYKHHLEFYIASPGI